MPVFTAAATTLLSGTFLAGSAIATSILATGLASVAGNVLGVFGDEGTGNVADNGVDIRLAPSTTNRIPVLYGKFQQRGIVNYFEVSEDKQKLYAVIVLGEGPVSSIDSIYWEDLLLTLDDNGVVTNAVDLDGTDVDRLNNKVTIVTYPSGGRSTFLEGNSDLWTSSHTMTGLAYAVVEATYDRENGITGIPDIRFRGTAPISNPAEAVEDMFTNSNYGLGLDASFIDTASITAATNYFNELIDYVDTDGVDQQQKRAEVNGVLNTGDSVFDRVETILTGCNASLRWADGKWGIFLNKSDSAVAFNVDESNIIGSISVTETGLNNLYNAVEVQYGRDVTNNYQRGTVIRKSPDSVRYPSEIDRKLTINLPLVHNSVEAAAVATVILNQGRQQLTVRHRLDATGMPLEAGDVVRYTDADYGWSFKLFRIISTTEVNDGGILAYDIEAVEYADAVYDYGVLNETDVAPNVPPNNANSIEAVNDLAVSGQFPNRSIPAVQLTWTVPSNSLIETFDVFFSVGGTQFNSSTTIYAKSVVSTTGTFTAGATIVEDIPNIPSGNITLWVVGRNDFVRSAESNGVTIANYQPNPTAAGTTVYRFNETPSVIAGVDIDVGAPPATETAIGVGRNNNSNDTGWYESELDADNRENAPVWTAVTTVNAADAEPRELDFTFSGTSGDTVTTDTPTNQIIDFELAGALGDRELQYAARPEITQFTFSGQAAEADSVDPGVEEVWQIDVTGSTDGDTVPTNEEFYLLPAGTSDTYVPESFTFTPDGDTGDGSPTINTFPGTYAFNTTGSAGLVYLESSGTVNGIEASRVFVEVAASDRAGFISVLNQSYGTNINIGSDFNRVFSSPVDVPLSVTVNGTETLTLNNILRISYNEGSGFFNIRATRADTTGTAPAVGTAVGAITVTPPVSSSVSITIDTTTNDYTLADNLSGGAAVGAALNTAIGTDFTGFTKTFDAATGAVTLTSTDTDDHTGSSSVIQGTNGTITVVDTNVDQSGTSTTIQLQVSELTLDQTIELASNVTGQNLLDDIETKLLANTAITNQFTVTQDTATIDGNSVTIVKLVAIPIQNLSLAITINSGITGTTSGTLVDGAVSGTATSITLTYDPDILPVTQMLTFGENATSIQVAAELTALISGHGDLEAVQGDTFIEITQVDKFPVFPDNFDGFLHVNTVGINNNFGQNRNTFDNFGNTGATYEYVTTTSGPPDAVDEARPGDYWLVYTSSSEWKVLRIVSRTEIPLSGARRIEFELDLLGEEGNLTFPGGSTRMLALATDVTAVQLLIPVATTFVENTNSSSVLVKPDIIGNQTQPIITVTTQGTGDAAFAVSTQLEGRSAVAGSPAFTGFTVSYGSNLIESGIAVSGFSASEFADQLATDINQLSQLTATSSGSVITVTSTANSSDDIVVSVIPGTNGPGATSTNDLAVSRTQINLGSATDVFAGVDSTVTVRVSGEVYYTDTFNVTDDTIPSILAALEIGIDAIVPGFDLDERWDGDVLDTSTIRATALATGTDPTISISIAAGSTATVDSIGNITVTPATLNSTATVVDPGVSVDITDGELSNFTVTQGTNTLISAMDITGGSSASSVVSQIALAIAANTESVYTTSASDLSILATLIENNNVPDLTISVSPGLNTDNSAADLAVARTVIQEGSIGTIDLTDAVWTYFISAPTVDNDTTMIGTDGTIQVRRGLVLDTTELQETSPSYDEVRVISSTQHAVGNKDATLIMTGLAALPAISTSTLDGANSVGYSLAYTTNDPPVDDSFTAITTYRDVQTNPILGVGLYSSTFQSGSSIPDDTWDVQGDGSVTFRGTTFQSDTLAAYIGLVTDGQPNTLEVPVTITITNMTNASSVITVSNVVAGSHVSGASELRLFSETGSTAVVTVTGTFDADDVVEFSVSRSDSSTWVDIDSLSFNTAFPAAYADQLVPVPLGISAAFDAGKDLTYSFRLVRTGDDTLGGFSWNMLLLEELRT